MDGLRISQLAQRVGVAPSTVRYYERTGLVPAPRRSASRSAQRSLGVFVLAGACLLACTVPALVVLTMFGAPAWLAVGAAGVVAIAVARGRRKGSPDGC